MPCRQRRPCPGAALANLRPPGRGPELSSHPGPAPPPPAGPAGVAGPDCPAGARPRELAHAARGKGWGGGGRLTVPGARCGVSSALRSGSHRTPVSLPPSPPPRTHPTHTPQILSYHIVPDVAATAASLTNGQKLRTLNGNETIMVRVAGGRGGGRGAGGSLERTLNPSAPPHCPPPASLFSGRRRRSPRAGPPCPSRPRWRVRLPRASWLLTSRPARLSSTRLTRWVGVSIGRCAAVGAPAKAGRLPAQPAG